MIDAHTAWKYRKLAWKYRRLWKYRGLWNNRKELLAGTITAASIGWALAHKHSR
jgi:hypothetical protein